MQPEPNLPLAPKPLAGCRVLDLSLLLPGPYCTSLLACFGAEVVKIEPPGGDPLRRMNPTLFNLLNRGKHSVVLDLKSETDRDAFLGMVAGADIVVDGFRPATLDRLGLSVAQMLQVRPSLVVGSISGFGWSGPYRDHPGHDIGFLSLAGYFAVPSQLDHRLVRPQVRLADMVAGQSAAFAMTMAWIEARRTGKGCHVDASILDATVAWTAPMLMSVPMTEDPAELPHVMADSALYRTADGQHLCIATLEDKFWVNFAQAVADIAPALGDARWATRRGRDSHKRELARAIEDAVAAQPLQAWLDRLDGVDTSVAAVYEGRETLEDPQIKARGFVQKGQAGSDAELFFPALFNGQRNQSLAPAPKLGQDRPDRFIASAATATTQRNDTV